MECPNTGTSFPWDHGPATEAHTCPFQVEINDDGEFQCECCERCTLECSNDI